MDVNLFRQLKKKNKKIFTIKSYYNNKLLLGFTHCPDICPEEMEKMCRVVDLVEKVNLNTKLQPIFITVDSDRDDAKAVSKYVKGVFFC